jgi:hypothetical protein
MRDMLEPGAMKRAAGGFDEALVLLQAWTGTDVVVRLDPEGTVMAGRLTELDPAGIDGALFAVDGDRLTGVAVALFRDGVDSAAVEGDRLVVRQGRMTVTVTRSG